MVASSDIARSKEFYDALFAAIGAKPGTEDTARGPGLFRTRAPRFMVTKPIEGKQATAANGGTIGFVVDHVKLAEAWHRAGVANGSTPIEDPGTSTCTTQNEVPEVEFEAPLLAEPLTCGAQLEPLLVA